MAEHSDDDTARDRLGRLTCGWQPGVSACLPSPSEGAAATRSGAPGRAVQPQASGSLVEGAWVAPVTGTDPGPGSALGGDLGGGLDGDLGGGLDGDPGGGLDGDPGGRAAGSAARFPSLPGPGPFDPGRRGIRALLAFGLLVVLIAAFLAWRSRPHTERLPAVVAGSAAAGDGQAEGQPVSAATGSGQPLVVAVAGKVRHPGLVRLPPGARVADAIDAAGGLLPGADVTTLNLARKVTDGELIVVGLPQPAGGDPAPDAGGPGGKVNLNTATLSQLDALPGVGPVLAQRILDHRAAHGGFRSVAELRQVDGIGDARYEELKDLVTV